MKWIFRGLVALTLVVMAFAANAGVATQLHAKTVNLMGVMQDDPPDEGGHAGCVACDVCSSGHVTAGASAGERSGNAHPATCGPGSCSTYHPTGCSGSFAQADLAASWNAAATKQYAVIRKMLKEHPKALFLNERRLALQWFKCNGMIGASLPLTKEAVEYLSH